MNTKKSDRYGWLLYLLPAFIVYTVFMAFPLADSIRLSFFSGSPASGKNLFVGLQNYKELFGDADNARRYWGAFGNTWYFFFIHMLVQNVLGLTFSLMLTAKGMKWTRFYQTIIFIPVTLAILVTGYLWKLILNPQWGALPLMLKSIGLESLVKPWLGEQQYALTALSLVSSWQWVGIPAMMILAGLQTIPDDLLEAADIAGCSGWQKIRYIKLPLIKPVLGMVAILTFVNNFNAFDVVFAMENVNGAPQYATDLIGTLFYRVGIAGQHPVGIPNPGMGAAIATVTFIMLMVGVGIMLRLTQGEKD
ncbi:sugar ABC transporter permease [Treponema vincentii]|jgi:ABC transporter, permease protein|uniref:carbohydrate ABC transporter permease n=2 Tax=Treponema vincentii TaxID=69710 RepID=UPI0020A4A7FF|nr:sugar ABC transporter permease [Treponema vincentii]UTC60684.1 sugar ABC transporter permease [Treponema vincentii]